MSWLSDDSLRVFLVLTVIIVVVVALVDVSCVVLSL
jgi:hypothetical protein